MPSRLQASSVATISSATPSATFGSACTPGSLIVVHLSIESKTTAFNSCADGTNTYTNRVEARAAGDNATGASSTCFFTAPNSSSSALTVTVTLAASDVGRLMVEEWSVADNSNAVDATLSAAHAAGPLASTLTGNITTTVANASVIAHCGSYSGGTTSDSGYTLSITQQAGASAYHHAEYNADVGSAGAKTLTMGFTADQDNWSLAAISIKDAGAESTALEDPIWNALEPQTNPLTIMVF